MDSGDGVELELNIGPVEKDPEANGFSSHINKENEIVENGADGVRVDCGSEGASKIERANSAGDKNEVSESKAENKASKTSKKGEYDAKHQVKKTQKSPGGLNGSIAESQKKRNVLSQSVSFPSRGSLANNLRKCTTFTRQSKVTTSNGDLTVKLSTLPAASTARKTFTNLKTGSVEATINGISAEAAESNDNKTKPSRNTLHAKKDVDANSTASSSTPCARKIFGCTFNFKLDERAEKRKEFFMKLEEKNHAKELEETNLQAKSKENQEAEIRRLRKSLNFKATPMPSFYQDSGPPKVELKKIPPTRAKSPKLGRRKPFVTAADSPSEAGNSCDTPFLLSTGSTELNEGATSSKEGNAVPSKKISNQKSFPKLSSTKLKPTQSDSKSLVMNPETSNLKSKAESVEVENSSDRPAVVSAEISANSELASPEDRVEGDKTIATPPKTDAGTVEVSVQG